MRSIVGETSERTRRKIIDRIDEHARNLIEHSPFVLPATAAPDGSCDVSPRRDPAGSVLVLDDRTLVPADRPAVVAAGPGDLAGPFGAAVTGHDPARPDGADDLGGRAGRGPRRTGADPAVLIPATTSAAG